MALPENVVERDLEQNHHQGEERRWPESEAISPSDGPEVESKQTSLPLRDTNETWS